jgi:serine/threonine protein kinase
MALELLVTAGPETGRRYVFQPPAWVAIGRGEGCEVALNDIKISRRHCRIELTRDACLLRDLGSANGTRVNGAAVESGALEDGDRVRLGDTTIECALVLEDGAEGPDAPVIAGYKVLEKIGEGRNGSVFRARQIALGRVVAVKVLGVDRARDPQEVARFVRGARAEALLSHPNVVQVFDFVRTHDVHVVMEYVEGRDLRALGRLAPGEAAGLALQVLAALQHAYERRIVHRDVKPENVLVTAEGVAKLTDFGLARSFAEAALSGITRPSEGAGTPSYMPPEQLRAARTVDQRADVYAAGATLHHLLAGAPPFRGTVAEVVRAVLQEAPPPLAGVPEGLGAAVARALAKDPAARFQTPAEFAAAIAPFADARARARCGLGV